MKAINKLYFASLILMLSTVSCNKDFLNDKPYTAVVLQDAIKTESDMLVAVTGAYSQLRNTDLYGRTLPVKGDLMGDNTYVTTGNSGRYTTLDNFNMINTDAYGLAVWQQAYVAIKYANTIIAASSSLTSTTTNTSQYLGEAYAIRALMYFELARNYGHPYTTSPNDPAVPLVLTYDQNALPARNTVKDVYTQVIADLEKAYSLMTVYRGTAFFSKYSARALEARVYQNMGDWANALTTATDVITNGGFTLTPSIVSYWNSTSLQTTTKVETMFEISSDVTYNNGFDQIGFIYIIAGGSGYADIFATPELYSLYSATDTRKALIVPGTRTLQTGTANYVYKYPNPANASGRDATKVIRYADVLLIAAEAYYNKGDYTNANLYLNKVATLRDPSFAGWADTGPQVLEDILIERRKELAFEGSRFWDLIRLQRNYTKVANVSNNVPSTTFAITPATNTVAPNTQLIFPIPLTELNANPNMKQNPGY